MLVHYALADGVPIELVAALVGHASVAATGIYSNQEQARKISAVHALKQRTDRCTEPGEQYFLPNALPACLAQVRVAPDWMKLLS